MDFKKYLLEEEGCEVFEKDGCFIAYKIENDGMFVSHLYVPKEKRGLEGLTFGSEFLKFVKKKGVGQIIGNIFAFPNEAAFGRKILLFQKLGFSVLNVNNNVVQMIKKI